MRTISRYLTVEVAQEQGIIAKTDRTMIGGIFFLASIIAIFVVLDWFRRNDRVPENEPTRGLLAMKVPGTDDVKPKGKRRWTREDALRR